MLDERFDKANFNQGGSQDQQGLTQGIQRCARTKADSIRSIHVIIAEKGVVQHQCQSMVLNTASKGI